MKSWHLVISFLPLVLFSLLARFLAAGDIGIAAVIAAVVAAAALVTARPPWPPKILNAASFVLFTVIAVTGFGGGTGTDKWLATWAGAGVGLVLGLFILALVPVIPFTEQYARESTPQAYWGSPTFKQLNRVLSTGWGLAIGGLGVSRLAAAAIEQHSSSRAPQLLLGLAVPIVVLVYMVKFTKSYPERVTHQPDAHQPS